MAGSANGGPEGRADPLSESGAESLPDPYRREALSAFSHGLRTPLTVMRMVLDMRAPAGDGVVSFDRELVTMMESSLTELQRLADELHDYSRLERGFVALSRSPMTLSAVLEEAQALLGPKVALVPDGDLQLPGSWDGPRLARAIAGLGDGTHRLGNGAGTVTVLAARAGDCTTLVLESGVAASDVTSTITAEAGFAFFLGAALVRSMGGRVELLRHQRHCRVSLELPCAE